MFSIEHCKHRVKCNKRTSHSPFLNTSIQNYKYVNNTSTQDKPLNINKNTIHSANTPLHVIEHKTAFFKNTIRYKQGNIQRESITEKVRSLLFQEMYKEKKISHIISR